MSDNNGANPNGEPQAAPQPPIEPQPVPAPQQTSWTPQPAVQPWPVSSAPQQPTPDAPPAPPQLENTWQQPIAQPSFPTTPAPVGHKRQQPVNGFTIAGLVLAILAIIVALWAFGDYVSVFGVVGLALGIIGWFYTKDQAAVRGEKPSVFNRAIVVVVIVLSAAAIIITPIANTYERSNSYDAYSYYGRTY